MKTWIVKYTIDETAEGEEPIDGPLPAYHILGETEEEVRRKFFTIEPNAHIHAVLQHYEDQIS